MKRLARCGPKVLAPGCGRAQPGRHPALVQELPVRVPRGDLHDGLPHLPHTPRENRGQGLYTRTHSPGLTILFSWYVL